MQSNDFTVSPTSLTKTLPCSGSMIAYESGSSSTANAYLIIKGDGQSEIRLKPGQSVNFTGESSTWYIHADDPTATVTGFIIVGDGSFHDSAINATIAGAVTVTNTVNGQVTNNNAGAVPVQKQALSTITDEAIVTINNGAAQALISDATQRILRIRNGHATAMLYIGSSGVTAANAAIVLAPGDLWIEEEAAGAAWYATSDTAGCNVQIQGVK